MFWRNVGRFTLPLKHANASPPTLPLILMLPTHSFYIHRLSILLGVTTYFLTMSNHALASLLCDSETSHQVFIATRQVYTKERRRVTLKPLNTHGASRFPFIVWSVRLGLPVREYCTLLSLRCSPVEEYTKFQGNRHLSPWHYNVSWCLLWISLCLGAYFQIAVCRRKWSGEKRNSLARLWL